SLGLLIEGAYAVRALGRISQIPLTTIFHQIRPPLVASLVMMAVLLALDNYAIGDGARGVEGLGLLGAKLAAAAVTYLLALLVLSRHSVIEFRQVAGHLARRPRRPAPTAPE